MPIQVKCPGCESVMTVPDAAAGRFGNCRKCDTRLRVPVPEAESEIAFDDEPVQSRSRIVSTNTQARVAVATPPPKTMKQQYAEVPFYRRNGLVSFIVLLGFFTGLPLIIVCIIAATGDVYNPSLGDDGKLLKWGSANRYIAIMLLFVWGAVVVYSIAHSK